MAKMVKLLKLSLMGNPAWRT